MDNLIHSINPLHITRIRYRRGRRYGCHPYYWRLVKRRHNRIIAFFIRNVVGSKWDNDIWGDYFSQTEVLIEGQHKTLLGIECKSNAEAERIVKEAKDKLNNFFSELAVLEKLREGL